MDFNKRHIISINDLSKDEIWHILKTAKKLEKTSEPYLKNKIMASLFFEPSTRTRLSHESAMTKLGGTVIGFSDSTSTSLQKGETLLDTIRMTDKYADVIVMRHNKDGAARAAAEVSAVPIINAGDGANQHPTQTLLDLFTILKTQNKIDNLKIAIVGDLKYGRTTHSLGIALSLFSNELHFISPPQLRMPNSILDVIMKNGAICTIHEKIDDIINEVDIIYMTRIQKERFPDIEEYVKVKDSFILKKDMLDNVKTNLKILHPLPRVNEISMDIDDTKYAAYFDQAANSVCVRQALLCLILGILK